MKRILFFTIAFVLMFQVGAFADSKIGVFNMRSVMTKCDYGKAVTAKLKAKFEPVETELQREAEAIKKLETELKNQDLALKLDAKEDKKREYRRKARDYQDSVVSYRQRRQAEQQTLGQPIIEKIIEVMAKYGKDHNYTIIMEMSTGGVSYMGEGVDITDNLIEELNKMKKTGK